MTKQEFVNSDEFVEGVVSSTQAGFGGSGYSAEFFEDGTHRVLWNNQIGNGYEHPTSEIVGIPQLTESQAEEGELAEVAEFYRDELAEMFLQEEA